MTDGPVFATPEQAEAAFYEAFSKGDLDGMMQVWAKNQQVVCIHPGGRRSTGLQDVRQGWRYIFGAEASLKFAITESCTTEDSLIAIHAVKENILLDDTSQGVMLATNVYQFVDGSWRMVLHHSSPEPLAESETARSKRGRIH